jgi:hypothetical protein
LTFADGRGPGRFIEPPAARQQGRV